VAPNGRNHNKFAVIDRKRVITGSYNWTLKSEGNWENLLILDCPELAKAYENEWERIH
jgi:phosphatidylserine/phosphatidylglycerophosphate/cardiolipin synthase-like enzyme